MKGKGDNMNKEFAVFGLGKFGVSVAKSLMTLGCQVIVVDRNEERVQEIADDVTYAMVADVTDSQVLENLGIRNLDGVVDCHFQRYGKPVLWQRFLQRKWVCLWFWPKRPMKFIKKYF